MGLYNLDTGELAARSRDAKPQSRPGVLQLRGVDRGDCGEPRPTKNPMLGIGNAGSYTLALT